MIGDGVTVDGNIDMGDGDNQITIGSNNTFNSNVTLGDGADTVIAGDNNQFSNTFDTNLGTDTLQFGDGNELVSLFTGEGGGELRIGLVDTTVSQTIDGIDHNGNDGDPTDDASLFIELSVADRAILEADLASEGYNLVGNTWVAGASTDYHATVNNVAINDFENITIVCFAGGTRIETDRGLRPIEWLKPGDRVRTLDHGYQPIRWIGSKTVPAQGHLAPYIIEPGVLGNVRRVVLSPQHRVMLSGWQMELLFGEHEVLAPIKMLDNGETIHRREGRNIRYVHMLFDRHEVVYADGLASESFHPGTEGMSSLEQDVRDEIFELFPELDRDIAAYGQVARRSLKSHEAALAGDYLELAGRVATARVA